MHPNLTQALAIQKVSDLLREAEEARRAKEARPDETDKPKARWRFSPRLRRPAVA